MAGSISMVFHSPLSRCSNSQEEQDQRSDSWRSTVISSKSLSDASFSRMRSWSTVTSNDGDMHHHDGARTMSTSSSSPQNSDGESMGSAAQRNCNNENPNAGSRLSMVSLELSTVTPMLETALSLRHCKGTILLDDGEMTYNAVESNCRPPSEVILHHESGPYAQLCFHEQSRVSSSAYLEASSPPTEEHETVVDPVLLGVKIVEPVSPVSANQSTELFYSSSSSSTGSSGWSTGDEDSTTYEASSGGGSQELMKTFLWMDHHWYYQTTQLENVYILEQEQSLLGYQDISRSAVAAAIETVDAETDSGSSMGCGFFWLWGCCRNRLVKLPRKVVSNAPSRTRHARNQNESTYDQPSRATHHPPSRWFRYVTIND